MGVVANCVQPTVAFLNAQFQEVGVLIDVSVKVTDSGPVPVWGFAVKLATGAEIVSLAVMNPVLISLSLPPALVAVRLMS